MFFSFEPGRNFKNIQVNSFFIATILIISKKLLENSYFRGYGEVNY